MGKLEYLQKQQTTTAEHISELMEQRDAINEEIAGYRDYQHQLFLKIHKLGKK